MEKNNSGSLKKITFILLLVAFCGFAILSDLIVRNLNQTIDSTVLVAQDGTPATWDSSESNGSVNLSLEGRAMTDDFIQYTSSVANLTNNTIKITHLSSYAKTGKGSGFINFSGDTIEYSYDPSDNDSWQEVSVSEPANSADGFKLSSAIKVAPLNNEKNHVYFRYKISSEGSDEISDNFAILATDRSGAESKFVNTVTLATEVVPETIAIFDDENPSSDTDESYTKPLGVNSTVADTNVVDSVVATTGDLATPLVSNSVTILMSILGVFTVCFIGYLVLSRRK